MEQNQAPQQTITPPAPSGWLWKTLPLSPVKTGILAFLIFYITMAFCYAAISQIPFEFGMVIFGLIFLGLPICIIFAVVMSISSLLTEFIYRIKFKTTIPKQTFLIKYMPIILITLIVIGGTITELITGPAKYLQAAIMQDAPLPASVKNLHMLYRSGLPFDGIHDVWTFEIDPADFDKLLRKYKYETTFKPDGWGKFEMRCVGLCYDSPYLPKEPMTDDYSYPAEEAQDPSLDKPYTRIYTDKTHSKVIVTRYQY